MSLSFLTPLLFRLENDKFEAISYFLQSQRIREKIIENCKEIITETTFKERGDQHWIYQTLAQAYLGLENNKELNKLIPIIKKYSKGDFDLDTFKEQNKKLLDNIELVRTKNNYW